MRKKLLFLLPLMVVPFLMTSCIGTKEQTITNVVTKEGEEVEVMRIKNSITDVYKEASKSCVGVYASNVTSASVGSGVIYKKEGSYYYVVTNHHVINKMTSIKIYDGDKYYYKANLIGSDKTNDIAVLKFNTDVYGEYREFKSLDIFNEELGDIPTVGQTVLAIGCPLDLQHYNSVSSGIVSRYTLENITTDAALNPGNSGGGLFNVNGKLLGIVNSGQVWTTTEDGQIPVEGEGNAISIYVVKKCITDIESRQTEIERPLLGVSVVTVNSILEGAVYEEVKAYLPAGEPDICYTVVKAVVPNSLAENNGIKVNDVILEINGKKIMKNSEIGEVLHVSNPGDVINLKIYRSSLSQTIDVAITIN